MATTIVVPNEAQTNESPAQENQQLSQAIQYGQMIETNRQLQEKVATFESNQSNIMQTLQSINAQLAAANQQMDSTSRQTEQLQESQTAITSALMENSESEESSEVTEIQPVAETVPDEEEQPTQRTAFQKFLFGR